MADEKVEPYELAVTARCLDKDLGCGELVGATPEEQADGHELTAKFYELRQSSPIGQETVEGLQANIVAYSLHAGRWRGLTWHDREVAIVWLLAGRYHRSGEADDSYPHFRSLSKAALLPTEEDYEAVFDREGPQFAEVVIDDVRGLLEAAHAAPGTIVERRISGRIDACALVGADGSHEVAIRMQLHPGDEEVPAEWLMIVLAACFPDAEFEALQWQRTLGEMELPANAWGYSAPD